MRNGKKEYRAEGLVVDTNHGRIVLCMTAPNLYRFIQIENDILFGISANRLNEKEKYLPNRKITRSQVAELIGDWKIVRIKAPKKIRIVCS